MDRVALIGENSVEYVEKLINIWNEGNCAVLLDWRIPCQTLVEMMLEAGVRLCYIQEKYYETVPKLDSSISFVLFKCTLSGAVLLPSCIYDKYNESYSDDEAVVIYSSGTTGKSRGVILSHYAINVNADAIIDYMQPTLSDCIYVAKTLSHSSTLSGKGVYHDYAISAGTSWMIADYESSGGDSGGCVFAGVNGAYCVVGIHNGSINVDSDTQTEKYITKHSTMKDYFNITIY